MFKCFYPGRYYDSAYDIEYGEFYEKGYRGIIFDVDNTLVEHGAPVTKRAKDLFDRLHEIGYETCIISNNKEERVKPLADEVDSKYVSKANKPSPVNYIKAMDIMNCGKDNVFFVGDQIFTDVWGANRAGILSMLVKPIDKHEEIQIVLKRYLEKIVLFFYKRYCKKHGQTDDYKNKKYTLTSGFLSLFAYMLLVPLDTTTLADSGISFFNISYLGTKGVFVALLAGLIVSRLLALITEKNIVIKLPDSVPEMVSESLSSLLAGVIIAIVFLIFRALFAVTPYGNATDCIYTIIQTPLQSLTGNLPAFIIIILIAQLLWFFGIHGSMTVLPIYLQRVKRLRHPQKTACL